MSELPFEKLGPYKIDHVVGRGGMGTVFAARHELTGEDAAIKVLAPALASDETFRDRFAAEINSLKKLNHPHIVKLHGYGEADGHLYYAMELIEGTNLEQELLSGRRFSWREVTQIGIDVARALKHAHDHGVIHRDLKPANLLVDKDDEIKLTDFGIAKLFGATRVTLNDSVMGTADYMAPEQAAGEATTPRCDLYSLGCVLYALLAGTPPFKGNSIAEVVHKVRYDQHVPVSKYAPDVPRDLQLVINELLEKDPEDRIRTALSLTHRLRAIQRALTISTTEEDEFSSDFTERDETDRGQVVNPPPDIADRPTVFLPSSKSTPTEKSPISRGNAGKALKKKQLDHFTRVEPSRVGDGSRGNEFSSALPLMFLLLTVLGGLLGGIWYSTRPLSADDLHQKILRGADHPDGPITVSKDVDLFVKQFPDDSRTERIRELQEEIEVQKMQRQFEIRAIGRAETGKLSPVEVHCLDAFRAYRENDIESAIKKFVGIQRMYSGQSQHTDIRIQRVLEMVAKQLPQWQKELESKIEGLKVNLSVHRDQARALMAEQPGQARLKWQGMIDLHANDAWAADYIREAREAIEELGPIEEVGPLDSPSVTNQNEDTKPTSKVTPAKQDAKNHATDS